MLDYYGVASKGFKIYYYRKYSEKIIFFVKRGEF